MKKYSPILWLLLISLTLLSLPVFAEEEALPPHPPIAAVISRGFVGLDRECFADHPAAPVLTEESIAGISGLTAQNGYRNPLFPLVYDYAEMDSDVSTQLTTGSALAALLHERAPSAQLLLMKVYDKNMDYTCQAVTSALSDAHALGASIILLDISALPAPQNGQPSIEDTLKTLHDAGVLVICSAGDRGSIGYGSNYSEDENIHLRTTANPDSSTLSAAGALSTVFSVASAMSDDVEDCTLLLGEHTIPYTDTTATYNLAEGKTFRQYFSEELPALAIIPGVGKPGDFAHQDISGKIALIKRGELPFAEKVRNAAEAGAVGVIVYDNEQSDSLINMELTGASLPAIFISAEHGDLLLTEKGKLVFRQTNASNEVAFTSSWGTAPDLTPKPDLIAEGEMVSLPSFREEDKEGTRLYYSGSVYAAASTAAQALYLQAQNPQLTGKDLRSLLCNTALPLVNAEKIPLSPRRQGAGMLTQGDISPVGLLSSADGASAIALGDQLGSAFLLQFTLTNPTDVRQTYSIGMELLGDSVIRPEDDLPLFIAEEPYCFERARFWIGDNNDMNLNQRADNYTGHTVTLAPGASRTTTVYVSLDKESRQAYSKAFPNGYFLEGYITASTEDSAFSIPFQGFSDDFQALAVFDRDIYQGDSFYYTNWLAAYRRSGYTQFEDILGEIISDKGMIYDDSLLCISPNGDASDDVLYYSFCLLRTAYHVGYEIRDTEGKTIYTGEIADTLPVQSAANASAYEFPLWDGSAMDNPNYIYPDGEYTLILYACSSPAQASPRQVKTYTFHLDTSAPQLDHHSVTVKNGRTYLQYTLSDPNGIKSISITNQTGKFRAVSYTGEKALTWSQQALDITSAGRGYLYLEVSDYAGNVTVYRLNIK